MAVVSFFFFQFKQMEFNIQIQTMCWQMVQMSVHSVWSETSSSGNVCSLLMACRDKLSYIERRMMHMISDDIEICRLCTQQFCELLWDGKIIVATLAQEFKNQFVKYQQVNKISLVLLSSFSSVQFFQ